jgi:uncharacterized protein (DUF1015 family)
MADVRPFPGLRFAAAERLDALVTPPYDVISPEAQARYYARDPHNIIRLELGRDEPGDDDLDNRYSRAAMTFAEWRRDGVLTQDAPSLYIYEQEFSEGERRVTRLGIQARVRLHPWADGVVLPHERTLTKAKSDRLRLLNACAANLSPVMSLYDDPDHTLATSLVVARDRAPDVAIIDEAGEGHRLWRVDDPAFAARVAGFFAERKLYIADGHHRYETALTYRDEQAAARKGLSADDPANFVLMTLVAVEDPGLVVWPTHRLVRGLDAAALAALRARLDTLFTWRALSGDLPTTWLAALAAEPAGTPALVIVTRDGAQLVTLTEAGKAAMARVTIEGQAQSVAWCTLDVAVAQELVLGEGAGISREDIRDGDRVSYARDAADAVGAVHERAADMALLLRATPPAALRDVALAGDRMPQKSTYFYPKLITGLVINPLW